MPVSVSLTGNGLKDLNRKMKALGDDKALRRELHKELRSAGKTAIPAVRRAAASDLPKTGGLAERMARAPMTVQVGTKTQSPYVRVMVKGMDPRSERGRLRHPVYARGDQTRDQWTWVTQPIKPDWFTDAMRSQAPLVRRKIVAATQDFAKRVERA